MSLLLKALAHVDSLPPAPGLDAPPAAEPPAAQTPAETLPKAAESKAPSEPESISSTATIAPGGSVPSVALLAVPPAAGFRSESEITVALNRLDRLGELLTSNSVDTTEVHEPQAVGPRQPLAVPPPPTATDFQPPAQPAAPIYQPPAKTEQPPLPPLRIRHEVIEFRDHLLSRQKLSKHSTLIFIDGGRGVQDASWLMPLAAGLHEIRRSGSILLVEAAGEESRIARSLGLENRPGIGEVLQGSATLAGAVQPTSYPHIQLLTSGAVPVRADQQPPLKKLWSELKQCFDLLLVAAGPLHGEAATAFLSGPAAVDQFLSLADAAIVSIELDATPQTVAAETTQWLQNSGVKLLGCVVRGGDSDGS